MKRTIVSVFVFALVAGAALAQHSDPRSSFTRLDADGNGYVSQEELKAQPRVVRDTSLYAYGSFELADVNDDEQLSEAEFSAFEEPLPVE